MDKIPCNFAQFAGFNILPLPALCVKNALELATSIRKHSHRTNTRLGDRSFSVAGPRNGHFKQLLKAFLFGETASY